MAHAVEQHNSLSGIEFSVDLPCGGRCQNIMNIILTMWARSFLLLATLGTVASEITVGGFDRTMSKGVTSLGYKIIYGEENMMAINEVVNEAEKLHGMKSKININDAAPPLPAEDVKCLMSSDNYCTKDMFRMKRVLFESMKNDCAKCSAKEKDKAGKVVASLMAHDHAAWKMFLTRYALLTIVKPTTPKQEDEPLLRPIGLPEEIKESKSRKLSPGSTVRVKRYVAVKL